MMRCSICRHPEAETINTLLGTETLRDIVKRFPDVTTSALWRHKVHISPLLRQAKQAADAAAGEDVLGGALAKLDAIEAEARRLARVAEKKGDVRTAGHLVVSEGRALVELVAKLKGLLQSGGAQVNVAVGISSITSIKDLPSAQPEVRRLIWEGVGQVLHDLLPPDVRRQVAECIRQRRRDGLDVDVLEVEVEELWTYPEGYSLGAGLVERLTRIVQDVGKSSALPVLQKLFPRDGDVDHDLLLAGFSEICDGVP